MLKSWTFAEIIRGVVFSGGIFAGGSPLAAAVLLLIVA
jgi:hypothetical protein